MLLHAVVRSTARAAYPSRAALVYRTQRPLGLSFLSYSLPRPEELKPALASPVEKDVPVTVTDGEADTGEPTKPIIPLPAPEIVGEDFANTSEAISDGDRSNPSNPAQTPTEPPTRTPTPETPSGPSFPLYTPTPNPPILDAKAPRISRRDHQKQYRKLPPTSASAAEDILSRLESAPGDSTPIGSSSAPPSSPYARTKRQIRSSSLRERGAGNGKSRSVTEDLLDALGFPSASDPAEDDGRGGKRRGSKRERRSSTESGPGTESALTNVTESDSRPSRSSETRAGTEGKRSDQTARERERVPPTDAPEDSSAPLSLPEAEHKGKGRRGGGTDASPKLTVTALSDGEPGSEWSIRAVPEGQFSPFSESKRSTPTARNTPVGEEQPSKLSAEGYRRRQAPRARLQPQSTDSKSVLQRVDARREPKLIPQPAREAKEDVEPVQKLKQEDPHPIREPEQAAKPVPEPKEKRQLKHAVKVRIALARSLDEGAPSDLEVLEKQKENPPRLVPFGRGKLEILPGGVTFVNFPDSPPPPAVGLPRTTSVRGISAADKTDIDGALQVDLDSPLQTRTTRISLTNRWLRDNCQCASCIQPSTGQKLRRSGDFGEAGRITVKPGGTSQTDEAEAAEGLRRRIVRVGRVGDISVDGVKQIGELGVGQGEEGLIIEWGQTQIRQLQIQVDPETGEATKGLVATPLPAHETFLPASIFAKHLRTGGIHARTLPITPSLWTAKDLKLAPTLRIPYDQFLASDETLHAALTQLGVYGLVILKNVPTERTSDEECELRRAMGRIGEIRNTFYGSTWNVQARKDSKNVAYTNVNLGLHQDLLYFENPPRFQALHCLRNKVEGGSSYFVDSFKAAEILFNTQSTHYLLLATTEVPFHYDNDGYNYYNRHKTIESYDPAYSELRRLGGRIKWYPETERRDVRTPNLHAINYSPPFQAPCDVDLASGGQIAVALQAFEQILDSDALRYEFTMEEGDLALFDNRRVLHARREFSDKPEHTGQLAEGEATRWLKGCYLDGDVVWNKQRVLSRKVLAGELVPQQAWNGHLEQRELLPRGGL